MASRLEEKDGFFHKNVRMSSYYPPDFINPLLTDKRLEYLMYTHTSQGSSTSVLTDVLTSSEVDPGTQVEIMDLKELGGYNRKNAVNAHGSNAFPIEIMANLQDLSKSAQFQSIFAGARCKRELSDPGNRIPNQNRNPANINHAQNGTDNAADNSGAQATNNGQIEAANLGAANVVGEDGGNHGGGGNDGQNETMVIYRYELDGEDLHIALVEVITTTIIANNCQSWGEMAQNILEVWTEIHGYIPPIQPVTPANCWSGAETIFGGRRANEVFDIFESINWRNAHAYNFGDIKRYLNTLLVIENVNGFAVNGSGRVNSESDSEDEENVMLGDGRINTYLYDFLHGEMRINLVRHFDVVTNENLTFQSWMEVARQIYREFQERANLAIEIQPQHLDPGNCWPGTDTIFGCWVHGRFQSLNWPTYDWENVEQQINCLILIRYQ